MQNKNIEELLKKYNLNNDKYILYLQAFTHPTYKNENKLNYDDYQRLELLGDSVILLVITDYLYKKYLFFNEGDITDLRQKIVQNKTHEVIAENLELLKCCFFGKGIKSVKDFSKLKKDVFESLMGAIYLSEGIKKCKAFLKITLIDYIEKNNFLEKNDDYKSTLQKMVQKIVKEKKIELKNGVKMIEYFDGQKNLNGFNRGLKILGKNYSFGKGDSKKNAEQEAAKKAIKKIKKNHL